jgi:hypothetical protein
LLVPVPVTLVQPQDKSSQQLAWYQAALFLHPGSAAGESQQLAASRHQPLKTYLQQAIYHVIQAMDELDNSCAFSKRLYVPPTYAELRKIINIAQVQPPSASSCCPHHTARSPPRVIPPLQPVALAS